MEAREDIGRRGFLLAGAALAGASLYDARPAVAASRQGFRHVAALIRNYVADGRVAGVSVAVKHRAAPVRYLNAGHLTLGGGRRADEHGLFRIYSMTKPITGVAAMMLVGDGRLSLDQPLADILPQFSAMRVLVDAGAMETRPAAGPILVRHLLTHTAGFSYAINSGEPLPRLYREGGVDLLPIPGLSNATPPCTLDDFADRLAPLPLGSDPGARMDYSVSLDLLGLVIQRVSGRPFAQFLRERLFDPLGMNDTGFYVPGAKLARLATNYRITGDALAVVDARARSSFSNPEAPPSGGAGLVSSARDYMRFCAMLLNDGAYDGVRVMAPRTVRLACANLAPPGVLTGAGDGFAAGMRVVLPESARDGDIPAGAVSWGGAAGTTMWVDHANSFALVMMTQFMPQDGYPIWEEIRRAAYADLSA